MASLVDKVEAINLNDEDSPVETPAIEGEAPSIGNIKACCGLGRCMSSESPDTPLKHCGQCKKIKYCCREHQVEHFKYGGHKLVCDGRKNAEVPLVFDNFVQAADTAMKVRDFKTALINYGAMLELTEKNSDIFHPKCANILDQVSTHCLSLSLITIHIMMIIVLTQPSLSVLSIHTIIMSPSFLHYHPYSFHTLSFLLDREMLQRNA